jgi:AraC family transcriptional regulator
MVFPDQPPNLRAAHPAPPRLLTHGQFFGRARRERCTDSFAFASMVATWSEEELPRHSHENAYFFVVLRGTYLTAACADPCGPSTLIFNPPGTTHRDRFHSRDGRFFTISLSPAMSQRMPGAPPLPVVLRDPEALRLVHHARLELCEPDGDSDFILEGLGLELAGLVLFSRAWPDPRAPLWLVQARDLLIEGGSSRLTIADIARAAGVHPVHLARTFRQYFHCAPGEYLRACRIEKARRLLAVPGLPLAELAQQAGFCDQSQLTHAFKRATGRTPGEYRRSLRH